jgi:DNA-sulfur modification-associated
MMMYNQKTTLYTQHSMNTVEVISVQEFIERAIIHPDVQRDFNQTQANNLAQSFKLWFVDKEVPLMLPMFFAVKQGSMTNKIEIYDGQHRLAALRMLSQEGTSELLAQSQITVSVLPETTPLYVLKAHFNAVNKGLQVSKNLQAKFSDVWGDLASQFDEWELNLIETTRANSIGCAFAANDLVKLFEILGINSMLIPKAIMGLVPKELRQRSPMFKQYACFSAHLLTALGAMPNYIKKEFIPEFIGVVCRWLDKVGMEYWASTKPFTHFWVETKNGFSIAPSGQARKAWVAKLLEMLIDEGYSQHIAIPAKYASILSFSEYDLEHYVFNPVTEKEKLLRIRQELIQAKAREKEEEKLRKAQEAEAKAEAKKLATKAKTKTSKSKKPTNQVADELAVDVPDVEQDTSVVI